MTPPISIARQTAALVLSLAVCFVAAAIGGLVTSQSVEGWYSTLQKPAWSPPNWIFGPVWTLLYAGMAIAAWLVWRERPPAAVAGPLPLFGIQLLLNVGWSVCFFGWRSPGLAFADIVVLWLAIVATLIAFWRYSRLAGLLLVPYLAWVSFAAILNFEIWRLNR